MKNLNKRISLPDQQHLEKLLEKLKHISEQLINLLANNNNTLSPQKGARFFNENAEVEAVNGEFYSDRNFQNKLESYIKFSITLIRSSSDYFQSASQVVIKDPRQTKDETAALFDTYETAARKYFNGLNKTNALLSELIKNRLNKTNLLKTPNISDDIKRLESCIDSYELNVNHFAKSLTDIARQLVEDAIENNLETKTEQTVEFLNFKIAIDTLTQEYQQAYDKAFGLSGFWRKIKEKFQKSERGEELEFLKSISNHPQSNDPIRYQAMALVHNKISESEFFGENSHLKKILHRLLINGYRGYENQQNDFKQFMSDHPEITMPSSLEHYFQDHNHEYSNNTVGLI